VGREHRTFHPRRSTPALFNFLYEVNEVDNGNHVAAWQEPNLFTEEIRAASADALARRSS
jgi:hypothetical protein